MKYDGLIASMTLEEKCSLLSGATQFTTKSIPRLGVPAMFLADGPHGLRKQAGAADHLGLNPSLGATCFPTAAATANAWDEGLLEALGAALGEEAAAQGVSVVLGPGLNLKRSPLCGRNFEYFSEDPYLSGKLAAAEIRGIQSKGVAACPKHFAVNSQETLRMHSDSVVDARTLRELYLTGFEIAVKEGQPLSLMSSYNRINGVYASENKWLLQAVLREEWGFTGFVVTDWGGSNDHVAGVKAGNHLEMPSCGGDTDRALAAAVRAGALSEALLDRRVDEYLSVLFTVAPKEEGAFDREGHHALARRAAAESAVLLKNEGQLLPLKAGTKVAVIGDFAQTPRYQGAGSSAVNPTRLDTLLDQMGESGLALSGYEPGYLRHGGADEGKKAAAVGLARSADAVLLCVGLDELGESEGLDRPNMALRPSQVALIEAVAAANPNTVAIVSCGCAVEAPWADGCAAVLYAALGGQAGAGAVLDLVTGKANPGGKLAETWPLRGGDVPCAAYYPGKERTAEYREGPFVGYRYYAAAGVGVRWPFGYGLSYTTFAYADLTATAEAVSFTLTNTGERAGAEIAQLYVGKCESQIIRPRRELKGFVKVPLAPGERRRVTIPLDDKAFRYFNPKSERFEVEGGVYTIEIGASSEDIRLNAQVEVSGTDAPAPYEPGDLPHYFRADVKSVPDREFEALLGRRAPPGRWDRGAPLERNDAICQLAYAKSGVGRLVCRVIARLMRRAEKKGKPDLNLLFISSMPLRGIAKMMGGAVNLEMVDAMLEAANGRLFTGLGHLLSARRRLKKAERGGGGHGA